MNIDTRFNEESRRLVIAVSGRLDFKVHKEFRQAYEGVEQTPAEVVVDLRNTEYMDSSGLGMLLLLRDYYGAEKSNIRIESPNEELGKVLAIANFDKLFTIA